MTMWVLVANSSFAEIFAVDRNGRDIRKMHQLDFPGGRLKGGDVYSDKSGRTHDSIGPGRHSMSSEVDFHSHEQKVFAHQIGTLLRKAKEENAFDRLALIAPPQFLGELRQALHETVQKLIYKEINKEIHSDLTEYQRIEALCRFLDLQRPVNA